MDSVTSLTENSLSPFKQVFWTQSVRKLVHMSLITCKLCLVWQNDTLIRNYNPCRRSSNYRNNTNYGRSSAVGWTKCTTWYCHSAPMKQIVSLAWAVHVELPDYWYTSHKNAWSGCLERCSSNSSRLQCARICCGTLEDYTWTFHADLSTHVWYSPTPSSIRWF